MIKNFVKILELLGDRLGVCVSVIFQCFHTLARSVYWWHVQRALLIRHCLRVRYRTSRLRGYGSGPGPLDTDSRGPVPDPEPRLWGLSRGPVVCETTTDKSRDTGPYLHVYVVTVILPTKTHVEVSLCFVRHLWSSKGNQYVFTVMRHTIQTIKLIQKVYK